MKRWNGIFGALLVLGAAFTGGFFFGKNPHLLRPLQGTRPLVLGLAGDLNFPPEVVEWLQESWGPGLELRPLPLPLETLEGVDLIWALPEDLANFNLDPPDPGWRNQIHPRILRGDEKFLPILWKILPGQQAERLQLIRWVLGQNPQSNKRRREDFLALVMSPEFQLMLVQQRSSYAPGLQEILEAPQRSELESLPLYQLQL